jgi:hypothetical protein
MSYEIGYGKPPAHSRYRKGQSGNPGGRPGPRRAMERRMQAAFEELLFLSPAAFAKYVPRDGIDSVAGNLARAAARGKTAAIRLLSSFVSERGKKRPRRVRLPAPIKRKLDWAMSQGKLEGCGQETQSQGNSRGKLHGAHGPPAMNGPRGAAENAELRCSAVPAAHNLREFRASGTSTNISQGIPDGRSPGMRGPAVLRRSGFPAAHNLREFQDIRGPP